MAPRKTVVTLGLGTSIGLTPRLGRAGAGRDFGGGNDRLVELLQRLPGPHTEALSCHGASLKDRNEHSLVPGATAKGAAESRVWCNALPGGTRSVLGDPAKCLSHCLEVPSKFSRRGTIPLAVAIVNDFLDAVPQPLQSDPHNLDPNPGVVRRGKRNARKRKPGRLKLDLR